MGSVSHFITEPFTKSDAASEAIKKRLYKEVKANGAVSNKFCP